MKTQSKSSIIIFMFAAVTCLFLFTNSYAGNCGCTAQHKINDCSCWIKCGGYCTSYIKLKTGKQQSGNANQWTSNIKSSDVKKGCVAIFKSKCHVAYVEEVIKDKKGKPESVKISEYNYGPNWVDKNCIVTDKYGIVTTRTVKINTVDGGFWKP
ncbi:MAG: hypothetical protein HQK65_01985 [Desulfamplus sp.]|nr:hypothetical protein [Desulfamplus sp.]